MSTVFRSAAPTTTLPFPGASADRPGPAAVAPSEGVRVRFLDKSDMPALLALERAKWQDGQRVDAATLAYRIARYPSLSLGAFCPTTGRALASLFMKPTQPHAVRKCATWYDCTGPDSTTSAAATGTLFGISLSSVDAQAAQAVFEFFWPHALKSGWTKIYLGSPIPGLRQWTEKNPGLPVDRYVHSARRGLPVDPQLRYYHSKGFRQIVAVRENYFPHPESLNYGVLITGTVPLSALSILWRRLPLAWLQRMQRLLFWVL